MHLRHPLKATTYHLPHTCHLPCHPLEDTIGKSRHRRQRSRTIHANPHILIPSSSRLKTETQHSITLPPNHKFIYMDLGSKCHHSRYYIIGEFPPRFRTRPASSPRRRSRSPRQKATRQLPAPSLSGRPSFPRTDFPWFFRRRGITTSTRKSLSTTACASMTAQSTR